MQAIHQRRYGAPDALTPVQRPAPTPGPGELLVAVHATPVTQGDRRLRSGDFPGITWLPGRLMIGLTGPRAGVPGSIFAGRVVAVGDGVTRYAVGDDVFGASMSGALAERLVIGQDGAVARMPAGWTHAEAAALPYGAGTALAFVDGLGGLRAGERVLVIGAAGGVGRYAVQLARHLGARVVAVARPERAAGLHELGADEVIALDAVDAAAPFDLVLDTPGLLSTRRARAVLRPDGRYLTLNATLAVLVAMLLRPLLGGPRLATGVSFDDAASLERLRQLAEAGALRPTIARRFPLADAAAAHRCVEQERPAGEVIVEPVPAPPAAAARRA